MYTRCPHCTTIFRITAEQLRLTHGDVPCVTCAQPFNVLDSLSDDITELIAGPTVPDTKDIEEQGDVNIRADLPPAIEISGDKYAENYDTDVDTDTEVEVEAKADDNYDDEEAGTEVEADDDYGDEEAEIEVEADDDFDNDKDEVENEVFDAPDDQKAEAEADYDDDVAEAEIEADDDYGNEEFEDDETVREETFDAALKPETSVDADEDADDSEPTEDEQTAASMEFDAPEKTWTRFFLTTDAIASLERAEQEPVFGPKSDDTARIPEFDDDDAVGQPWIGGPDTGSFEDQTADQDEWKKILAELGDDQSTTHTEEHQDTIDDPEPEESCSPADTDPSPDELVNDESAVPKSRDEVEPSIILPWLDDETPQKTPEPRQVFRPARRVLGACAALALLLAGQLIHYNRDTLAASATYGPAIRSFYGWFGAPLYPDWPLDAFEVSGTEAIAGQSNANSLDVLANVTVHGRQPTGLPLIRIVLRDRWANPVASRVFKPSEYLRDLAAEGSLVNPDTVLPVEVRVADPGAEALGYVVDVCLPRRKTGLECQIAGDPFQ